MSSFALFTDGSFDPKTKIGVGSFLLLPSSFLTTPLREIDQRSLNDSLKFNQFSDTSSTQLEIETALWALEAFANTSNEALHLYTDSQGVAGLLERRPRLEATEFISKKTQRELNHAPLYRRFYALYDDMNFQVTKVAGHQPKATHDTIQRLFSIVDQGARKALLQSRKGA
jgi:ribonuclease HI